MKRPSFVSPALSFDPPRGSSSAAVITPTDGDFTIYGPDGEPAKTVPTRALDASDAALFHQYNWMLQDANLEAELFCVSCGHQRRAHQCEVFADDQRIAIGCQCTLRYFQGALDPPLTVRLLTGAAPDLVGGVGYATITDTAARVLRQWKRFLLHVGLQEAVRCTICFDTDRDDGCSASVTDAAIRIQCRCCVRLASSSGNSTRNAPRHGCSTSSRRTFAGALNPPRS